MLDVDGMGLLYVTNAAIEHMKTHSSSDTSLGYGLRFGMHQNAIAPLRREFITLTSTVAVQEARQNIRSSRFTCKKEGDRRGSNLWPSEPQSE